MFRIYGLVLVCAMLWACGGEDARVGESCAVDGDCEGDLICPAGGSGAHRCTAACATNGDCLTKIGDGFICGVEGLPYCLGSCSGYDDATCPGDFRCIPQRPGSSFFFCQDPAQ